MRSVKHAHRPVRRYRSLLFPGISVLAILVFYAAFVSPGLRKGETARFEQDGLRLEITGVHRVGGFLGNCDPERKIFEPFDTYYVYPGAVLTVLEASSAEETVRWELRRGNEELELVDGMDPVKLTEDSDLARVCDLDTGLTLLSFQVTAEDHRCESLFQQAENAQDGFQRAAGSGGRPGWGGGESVSFPEAGLK